MWRLSGSSRRGCSPIRWVPGFHACATSLGKGGKIGRSQWTYLSPSFQTTVGSHADNGRIEDVDGLASRLAVTTFFQGKVDLIEFDLGDFHLKKDPSNASIQKQEFVGHEQRLNVVGGGLGERNFLGFLLKKSLPQCHSFFGWGSLKEMIVKSLYKRCELPGWAVPILHALSMVVNQLLHKWAVHEVEGLLGNGR